MAEEKQSKAMGGGGASSLSAAAPVSPSADQGIEEDEVQTDGACWGVGHELWRMSDAGFEFVDPLTNGDMSDPVIAADGFTYERKSIEAWFRQNPRRSPVRRDMMASEALTPNVELHNKIARALLTSHGPTADVKTIGELNRIFNHLDKVREVLDRTLVDWRVPQIVVIGQESSGKSTLLERISMMSIFPRLDDAASDAGVTTCTRVKIEVHLRNSEKHEIPELQVIDAITRAALPGFEIPKLTAAANGYLDVRELMGELIEKVSVKAAATAAAAAAAGATAVAASAAVVGAAPLLTRRGIPAAEPARAQPAAGAATVADTCEAYITDCIIVLTVKGPHVPSTDLVDLPGIRQTGPGSEATKRMVDEHIKANADRSLFLFVCRAGEIKANFSALAVAQEHKEQHPSIVNNSIGVLTMLDQFSDEMQVKKMKQIMGIEENLFKRYGWVATMNRPPKETPAGAASNFQNLQKQAQNEVEFFEKIAWDQKEQLTTNNLIGQLNLMFMDKLKDTWMPGAMKKLHARLQQIDFERIKLGIMGVNSCGAAKEVERRMDAIMGPVSDAFNKDVLLALRVDVNAFLVTKMATLTSTKNQAVRGALVALHAELTTTVNLAVGKIALYWTEKVHATLVAETEQIAEVGGTFSLSTNIKGLLDIPWIGSAANKMDLYMKVKKKLEKEQFIQLSHYQEYTNQIRKKCAAVVAAFQSNVKNTTTCVLGQLVAGNSPWMTIKPDAKCEAVAVAVNITAFVDELVTAFVRHYPPDQDFLTLHAGVPLGSERHEAREQLSKLNKDFDAVNDAVAEIKKAFDIDTEAEKSMVAKVEWD